MRVVGKSDRGRNPNCDRDLEPHNRSLSLPSFPAEMGLLIPLIVGIVVAALSVAAILFVPRSPNSEYISLKAGSLGLL